ncbi:MAG TPA: FHIPEP family type III secretion protein, partial [Nannocystis sp.]
ELYGRLTIGDGLAAQVPALLMGLAASLLVARVDGEGPRGGQGWLTPAVLAAPAGLLAALSLAPGMPRTAFATTAIGLGALALGLWRARARPERRIVVCLAEHGEKDIAEIRRPLAALRRRCAAALGIEVPEIVAVAAREPDAPPVAVRLGERLISVPEDLDQKTWSSGQRTEAAVLATYRALMRHAPALIDLQTMAAALEVARAREPATMREALRAIAPADLLELSRGLLRERVPLPPLPVLLEAVASEPALRQASERGRWLEALRVRLAPMWVLDVIAARARLGPVVWVRPTPDAEAELCRRHVTGEGGARLRLSEAERRAWRSRVLAAGGEEGPPPLVVCSPRARPAFALLLARGGPHVTVLSTGELQEVELPVPGEVGGPGAVWFEAP